MEKSGCDLDAELFFWKMQPNKLFSIWFNTLPTWQMGASSYNSTCFKAPQVLEYFSWLSHSSDCDSH